MQMMRSNNTTTTATRLAPLLLLWLVLALLLSQQPDAEKIPSSSIVVHGFVVDLFPYQHHVRTRKNNYYNNKNVNNDVNNKNLITTTFPLRESRYNNDDDDDDDSDNNMIRQQQSLLLQNRIEEQKRASLVEAVMDCQELLKTVHLVGQAKLPTSREQRTIPCAVLAQNPQDLEFQDDPSPCTFLPLNNNGSQLKLLEFAMHDRKLSKSVMLSLNSLLINRDDALFDNVPWSRWSIDPQRRNYDAAQNAVADKFHLGKRDAYNRFAGKDWQGKSMAIGNLALRLKYMIESTITDDEEKEEEEEEDSPGGDSNNNNMNALAKRIMELQIREIEMDIAEWDYQIAVCRQNQSETSQDQEDIIDALQEEQQLQSERQVCVNELESIRQKLNDLLHQSKDDGSGIDGKGSSSTNNNNNNILEAIVGDALQDIADWTTYYGQNSAPYRGAIGYSPMLDSREDIEDSFVNNQYTSPYDLMRDIIHEQLNAEVIGCVLENTSLLQGTLAVGGAVVLRRMTPMKSVTIAGEQLSINDEDEEYGNQGIKGGETILVECDADEAVGMSLACKVPLRMESGLFERSSIMAQPAAPAASLKDNDEESTVRSALPLWKASDPELSVLVEGQAANASTTERVSPLRIPRTTVSLFDTIFDPATTSSSSSSSKEQQLFPTDNPIQSLTQYDGMSTEDKARTMMSMSNFDGRLPRPRVVRQQPNALDELLLPLVDESVRRQYRIQDAERRGDVAEAENLKKEMSKRQDAKERAEEAREYGDDDLAEYYDQEADLYGALRADVTQDEGSYSRFLDRDEWYERQRAQQAKKIDKKQFGTLLDGIE